LVRAAHRSGTHNFIIAPKTRSWRTFRITIAAAYRRAAVIRAAVSSATAAVMCRHCLAARTNCAALRSAAIDAVDGSSTGTEVPWMWGLLRLPRFGGAIHANGYDDRSRHRQVSVSGARR